MEAAEALELMAAEMGQIDTAFQFWLAATFAVVVAAHAVRESIDLSLKTIVTILYLLLTAFSVLKTLGDFQQVAYLAEIASAGGYDLTTEYSSLAGLFRFLLYFIATLAVSIYVWTVDRSKRGAT